MSKQLAQLGIVRPNGIESLIEVNSGLQTVIDGSVSKGVLPVASLSLLVFLNNPDEIFDRDYFDDEFNRQLDNKRVQQALVSTHSGQFGMNERSHGIRELRNRAKLRLKPHLYIFGTVKKEFLFITDAQDVEHGKTIVQDYSEGQPSKSRYVTTFDREIIKHKNRATDTTSKPTPAEDTGASKVKKVDEEVQERPAAQAVTSKKTPARVKGPADSPTGKKPADAQSRPKVGNFIPPTDEDRRAFYVYLVGTKEDAGSKITRSELKGWINNRRLLLGLEIDAFVRAAIGKGYIEETIEDGEPVYIRK